MTGWEGAVSGGGLVQPWVALACANMTSSQRTLRALAEASLGGARRRA